DPLAHPARGLPEAPPGRAVLRPGRRRRRVRAGRPFRREGGFLRAPPGAGRRGAVAAATAGRDGHHPAVRTGRPGRKDAGSGGRGPGRHGRGGAADREQGTLALRRGMDVRGRAGRQEARTVTTERSIVPPGRNTAAEAVALCQSLAGQLSALGFTPPDRAASNPLLPYLLSDLERSAVGLLLARG